MIIGSSLEKNKLKLDNEKYIFTKFKILKEEGAISELDLIEQKNKIIDLENNIVTDKGRLEENESQYRRNSQEIREN